MARAFSPSEILKMNIPVLPFEGDWLDAFGEPARTGTWIVWGASGNGKTSFVMQLAKNLGKYGKVAIDSLEESTGKTMQLALARHNMQDMGRRLLILDREPMDELSARLKKRKSPDFVIIDSFQYSGLTYVAYKAFKEAHPNKLLIFVSHADGINPAGRPAKSVAYDADVKIFVQGYRAFCKGRYITRPGVYYTIWPEGAAKYWSE